MFWSNKGGALNNTGKYDEAIGACDEAIRLDPNYATAWNNKGLSLASQGKYSESIKCFDEAIRLAPNDAGFLHNKEASLCRLGKCNEPAGFEDTWMNSQPSAGVTGHTYHGARAPSSSAAVGNVGGSYLANLDTKVYHNPSCAWAQNPSENRIWFSNPNEARSAGYRPCEKCNPP